MKRYPNSGGAFAFCGYLENYMARMIQLNRNFASKFSFSVVSPYSGLLDTLNNVNQQSIEKMYKVCSKKCVKGLIVL